MNRCSGHNQQPTHGRPPLGLAELVARRHRVYTNRMYVQTPAYTQLLHFLSPSYNTHTLTEPDTEQAVLQEPLVFPHTHKYAACYIHHTEYRPIERDVGHAHLAMTDMPPAPRRTAAKERSWSLTLPCSLGPMKSAARSSTSAM